jgi:hypothetical protein
VFGTIYKEFRFAMLPWWSQRAEALADAILCSFFCFSDLHFPKAHRRIVGTLENKLDGIRSDDEPMPVTRLR